MTGISSGRDHSPSPRTAVAHRFHCSADTSVLCDRGDGKPPRKACRHCRSPLVVETGQWAAFEWNPTGAYLSDVAVKTFASRPLADRWAEARNLVVRFVPDALARQLHPEITVLPGGRA